VEEGDYEDTNSYSKHFENKLKSKSTAEKVGVNRHYQASDGVK